MIKGFHVYDDDLGLRCVAADGEDIRFRHGDRAGMSKVSAAAIKNNDIRLMRF